MLSSRHKSLENSKIYIYHWCQKSQKKKIKLWLKCQNMKQTWIEWQIWYWNDKIWKRGVPYLYWVLKKMQFCTLSKGNFSQQLMKVPLLVFVIGESVISWSMNCPNPGSKFVNFVENFLCAFDIFLEIILGFGSSLPWWSRLRLSRSLIWIILKE